MARSSPNKPTEGDQISTDTPAGTELEITYVAPKGDRTITAYVTRAFDPYNSDLEGLRVCAVEPDARHPRFLSFSVGNSGPRMLEATQKLGPIKDVTVTGEVNDTYAAFEEFYASREGDVVRLNGDTYTVIEAEPDRIRTLEDDTGAREQVSARPSGLEFTYSATKDREDNDVYEYELTGERNMNEESEEVMAALGGYGYSHDDGVVEAVEIDGERYEVVRRAKADEGTVELADGEVDEEHRSHDTLLLQDALGLSLVTDIRHGGLTERVAVEEVTLVREG